MGKPHMGARKGSPVKVILKDGTRLLDKFLGGTDRFMFLEKAGRLLKSDVRAFSIYKPQPHERGSDGRSG